tara:strand:+ start:2854 stop:3576 length:723 start_codon:yes stop_codon:yes gene_type:complete
MSWLLLMFGLAVAEEPSAEIIVEAHRDIEVYVAPIEIIVSTNLENIEAEVDANSAFAYSSMYSHNAKIKNERGAYEPVELNNDRIKVYNEDTIVYAWDDCNYKIKPLACSVQNSHYYIETTVHVDDNELVVRTMMFDSDAQVIAQGVSTNRKIIKWIKQQEIQQQQTLYNQNVQGNQRNCNTTSCSPAGGVSSMSPINTITTTKPKEELPLKWTIPHRLLNKNIQQAMLLMWCSTRMDIY